jgi:hypothetical protein
MKRSPSLALHLLVGLVLSACGGGDSPVDADDGDPDEEQYPDPGPGAYYSVSPIELDDIARITPVGTNGKVLPIGHTYWYSCDTEWLMPVDSPCVRAHLPIRSPVDGTVFGVEHVADGGITIEGPRGLYAGFAHVTPTAGLQRGDSVAAGDTIAVMYSDFAIDFGMVDYHIDEHRFVNQERFADNPGYLHSRSPIWRFEEPLRSELLARVSTSSDPYGRISFDVAGTAAGNWFLEGIPFEESLLPVHEQAQLFLGPLQERVEVGIVSKVGWFAAAMDVAVAALDAPRWENITSGTGRVWIPLWQAARDGTPDPDWPKGGVLLEVLADERLRIEWFDTHEEPADFTGAAEVYER